MLKALSFAKPDGPNVKELLSLQLLGLSFAAAPSVTTYRPCKLSAAPHLSFAAASSQGQPVASKLTAAQV